ncbi:MAG TPA: oligopeptide/dipeptide ABC transporter ATP-binding protein [Armatimonadota bacterium]|nr:oligopeptide/dipeptide ABC transporter ATP-binding protein [Armatimonadota bacterium]
MAGCLHPYSQGLLRSTLDIDSAGSELYPIPGAPPSLIAPPPGCRFHPRCTMRQPLCTIDQPELRQVRPGHWVACHLVTKEGRLCQSY